MSGTYFWISIKEKLKKFFFFLFKKDILLIKDLSIRSKKFLIYYIILYFFLFIFIFYIEVIKFERFFLYIILFLIYLTFKILMELFIYIFFNNNKFKNLIKKNNEKFDILLKILLFIQKWKNPFLLLFIYVDKFFFFFCRSIIYYLKNYKYFNNITDKKEQYIYFFQYLILNIISGPFKLVFGFFYFSLKRMIDMPFSFFFIIRSMNFILSILIFSDLSNFFFNYFGYKKIYIFFYIFLIFISMIAHFINVDIYFLKIKYINNFIITDYIINIRNYVTFCGLLIILIIQYKQHYLLEKKYMNILSIYFKKYLEEGFYKYWEFYKRNSWLNTLNIWKEIKNRPSSYLYFNLNYWLNLGASPLLNGPNFITNILYINYKCEKLKLKFPKKMKEDLDYLYNIDILRLKLLLFMLWDIDNYIGDININRLTYQYDNNFNIYFLGFDYEFLNFDLFLESIKKNKKDLKFYDLEYNIIFFNRLYLILGVPPYDENPLETCIFNNSLDKYDSLIANLSDNLNNFYQDPNSYENETWERNKEIYDLDNNKIPLIENKIKDWIKEFIKERREEWNLSLTKESLEERNWRLLKEIEDLLLQK